MESTTNAQMRAKIVAIEQDALVLLVPDSGDTIRWPLSSIPQPFEVSDDMSLILHAGGTETDRGASAGHPSTSATGPKPVSTETATGNHDSSDEDKRKLLESLIN